MRLQPGFGIPGYIFHCININQIYHINQGILIYHIVLKNTKNHINANLTSSEEKLNPYIFGKQLRQMIDNDFSTDHNIFHTLIRRGIFSVSD